MTIQSGRFFSNSIMFSLAMLLQDKFRLTNDVHSFKLFISKIVLSLFLSSIILLLLKSNSFRFEQFVITVTISIASSILILLRFSFSDSNTLQFSNISPSSIKFVPLILQHDKSNFIIFLANSFILLRICLENPRHVTMTLLLLYDLYFI